MTIGITEYFELNAEQLGRHGIRDPHTPYHRTYRTMQKRRFAGFVAGVVPVLIAGCMNPGYSLWGMAIAVPLAVNAIRLLRNHGKAEYLHQGKILDTNVAIKAGVYALPYRAENETVVPDRPEGPMPGIRSDGRRIMSGTTVG